ncbi:ATP-dependent Clp protease ATP-binding subunit [Jeotgalibacillus salarius]|uniref:ATP-dependent Clp protease ATP-binding subunit n=1 Tax=Jeotgalibacillus salarius TaxID=546023 RepID=A0A4Y8LE77_9BACL|nr:ATP-dependent Clp protease ATP-binding subunit [Jeotgalibacillus salarius]TFE00339.1 ATP-dependent Clp protease ATP-binding subunit [Jeotgalibacillus salarius]
MICQKCQSNTANIKFRVQLDNQVQDFHLCSACYKEERSKLHAAMNNKGHDQFQPFDQMEQEQQPEKENGLLEEYGRNLTNLAHAGLIDPVIGRNAEIEQMIEILNRRNKNNPVLIGEPGIGKTAVAEGLALKISEGNVPQKLEQKEVILLDVASLVSNTGIRGQFEERMKQLISELQQRKNIILFIDEIHQIVGAGSAEGSMDAGNILKPALARGELQLVGATTLTEYRKIEKDAALERRFQPIHLKEPSIPEAIEILHGLAPRYEEYHAVTYSAEAIEATVTLSKRYIQDRFLPDKAIDLMDEAGSKLNLTLDNADKAAVEDRLKSIHAEKEEALKHEEYEKAAKLRDEEAELEKVLEKPASSEKPIVQIELIQKLIERKTGIPVGKLEQDEHKKMADLEENLRTHVIGQNEAVKRVAKAVRRSRAGLKSKNRPAGSFLFVGPTGVGKTELSKTLAEELFGSKDHMVRLDMSEYMEKHSVSKLIGSPPGYVGHDQAGQLTEKVRRSPYTILLLDEIEKAHPDVMHMFLQIMEDGRLTDSQGRTVSFKETVIIMTSNAGIGTRKKAVGFGATQTADETSILESLSDFFKPEFLNRFDSIIEFESLEKEHLIKIVDLMLNELKELIEEQDMKLDVTDEVKERIAELGYHPSFGARPLRRVIQETIEDQVTDFMYDFPEEKQLKAVLDENDIKIEKM